jgi:signal transduction histidine kinase
MAAIGEMAAAVAHELNNPLTTVTGFTELILESMSEDSPEYEDLSLVLKEAQRSRTVVRRLLDFSRQGEILHVESDINEIISNVLALVHHIAQTSNTEIRVEMWDDLPQISIDRNQIQQVILNLIHNGIQAMPKGGELLIHTLLDRREDGEWVGVVIKDTGEGIRKENIDKIFEPFFTTKPSGEGTGLGLSVSYNIVTEHGGYIDVNSQVGKGAEFSVWFPVSSAED